MVDWINCHLRFETEKCARARAKKKSLKKEKWIMTLL
jgi:hypothetical protein